MALLFPDADLPREREGLRALGATPLEDSDNGINKLVRFRAPGAALSSIAARPAVAWVEPAPHFECLNDNAQWVVQTNLNGNRRVWTMGIRGQGQVVMTSDTGIFTLHDMFRDPMTAINDFGDYPGHRKIIAYKRGSNDPAVTFGDFSQASWHGTHTAGTLCGWDDPVSGLSTRDGMAKEAKIYFMDIGGPSLGTSVSIFPDLNDLFLPPYLGNGGGAARISSNSWGGTPYQAYTLSSMQADQFIWNHPDFYITFANGNSASAGTVATPATAKSTAGAGGTQNGTSAGFIYTGTSRGPTADGRRKPTYCSPAQTVYSSVGTTSSSYAALTGTSMASPSGSGAVVLMRQYLTDGWYPTGAAVPANGFTPSAALLKAMAINSADDGVGGFTIPDNNIGWGRIDADNVLYFAGDAKKLLLVDNTPGLANGQYLDYAINVVDGSVPLKVSLCWSDYPGNPAAAVQLVNDLDLTVTKGATVYKGNWFSGGVSVADGYRDSANVEECVLVPAPATGLWTVRVAGPAVPIGPQPFALVLTGGVGNGAGALALDRAEYGSSSTMEIEVIDTNAGPTVSVSVASSTETTPESVTIAGANGVYHGTLALSPLSSGSGDGTLTVSNGDVLTATYNDASP
ncbi:MAG TPA: S8 family serine peptidase, partial [Acidimicrobiales bacterium]|nr:S8 family serine peptidase [Acidimicrobiales bacterium]